LVCLVLTAGAWREMDGIATYPVDLLTSAIEWRWGSGEGDQS